MNTIEHWRLKKQRYGLEGQICPDCKTKTFPPDGPVCRVCSSTKTEAKPVTDVIVIPAEEQVGR